MGSSTGRRARLVVIASISLALVTAGCGDGTSSGTPSRPTNASSKASTTGAPASTGTTSSTAQTPSPAKTKKKRNVIAWVLSLGPGAPEGPPEFTAYRERFPGVSLPRTEDASRREVTLPLYPHMEPGAVALVVDGLAAALGAT